MTLLIAYVGSTQRLALVRSGSPIKRPEHDAQPMRRPCCWEGGTCAATLMLKPETRGTSAGDGEREISSVLHGLVCLFVTRERVNLVVIG